MPGAIGVRRRRALTDSRGRMSNALADLMCRVLVGVLSVHPRLPQLSWVHLCSRRGRRTHGVALPLTDRGIEALALPASAAVGALLASRGRAGKPDAEGMPIREPEATLAEIRGVAAEQLPGGDRLLTHASVFSG